MVSNKKVYVGDIHSPHYDKEITISSQALIIICTKAYFGVSINVPFCLGKSQTQGVQILQFACIISPLFQIKAYQT